MNCALGTELRTALSSNAVVIGPWVSIPDPTVVEVMATLDNHFLLLDGEHSAMPATALRSLLPCAEVHCKPVIYRVPSHSPTHLKHALDAGVCGVMVPMVETPQQAAALVASCRYAPQGARGIGPWRASGYYTRFDHYLARANDCTTVVLQIESVTGLDNLEAIAAVEGYEVLYVGPTDLAHSLGLPIGTFGPEMLKVLSRICTVGLAAGKTLGIDAPNAASLPALIDMGFSFFTLGSEMGFMAEAGNALTAELATLTLGKKTS